MADAATIETPLQALIDLAIDHWRLSRWLLGSENDRTKATPRQTVRRLESFFADREISILDITGRPYEAGLPVEVPDTIDDPNLPNGEIVVDEVLSPIILWRKNVVRHAKIVVRRGQGAPKATSSEDSKS
ncbi:MAG: hypothetical protein M0D55_15055 [Elusimicrobiota bacterium]|nr:MAG: hypothetical protein M0D55_15055 [Elusimicrobiota bacterium]